VAPTLNELRYWSNSTTETRAQGAIHGLPAEGDAAQSSVQSQRFAGLVQAPDLAGVGQSRSMAAGGLLRMGRRPSRQSMTSFACRLPGAAMVSSENAVTISPAMAHLVDLGWLTLRRTRTRKVSPATPFGPGARKTRPPEQLPSHWPRSQREQQPKTLRRGTESQFREIAASARRDENRDVTAWRNVR
jgi:hypothetical protein